MNKEILNKVINILSGKDVGYAVQTIHAQDGEELFGVIVKKNDSDEALSAVETVRGYHKSDPWDDKEWGDCVIVY